MRKVKKVRATLIMKAFIDATRELNLQRKKIRKLLEPFINTQQHNVISGGKVYFSTSKFR